MSVPNKVVRTKLFIGNLDPGTQPEELHELFSPFGTVLESSVLKDYGFIHYGTIEEAEKAAIALNNKEFHGKRLRVELSTSTVRHRPGQPEPASALRHSRGRSGGRGHNNGVSRYRSGTSSNSGGGGGGGPMRHHSSGWARNEAHPYDTIPMDHGAYDRSRQYDNRSDSRHYYEERRPNGYAPEYDTAVYSTNSNSGQSTSRHYRDMPAYPHPDDYAPNRPYDRHIGMPPVDPYYGSGGSGLPQGPPSNVDPYHNYDPYQKYYASRPRDPEFPGQREYDLYSNYRNDAYGITNGNPSGRRHDIPVDLPSTHRSYSSGSSSHAQYYGIQQR